MRKHLKSLLVTILKLCFAFGALGYVLYKTDVEQIATHIKTSNFYYLIVAFVFLHVSTLLSSHRLKIYFEEDQKIPEKYVIPAFYMNTFFNTVLPGGIGGDGYLALLFKKHFKFPILKSMRLILASRANGLFFLNLFFFGFLWVSDFAIQYPELKIAIIVLFVLQFPVYAIASRILFKEKLKVFLKAGLFSFLAQVFFIAAALLCFEGIGITENIFDYLALFIASAIASVIPITPGGVGLRELIFYKGSLLVNLDPHLAVAGSLTYYAVYFSMALTGLAFYLLDNKMHHRRAR